MLTYKTTQAFIIYQLHLIKQKKFLVCIQSVRQTQSPSQSTRKNIKSINPIQFHILPQELPYMILRFVKQNIVQCINFKRKIDEKPWGQ